MPPLAATHWDPIWAAAQEAGVPVNFHVGGGSMGTQFVDAAGMGWMTNFAKVSSLIFMDNMRCIADLIFGGVCHRFPRLNFVSVESGVGWLPAAMETFDWQWRNGGVLDEHPEYDLLPSEYFRRQIYGCFWFEEQTAIDAIGAFPDNILFETDYPHPTCQHPGPRTPAQRPREYASRVFGGLSDEVDAQRVARHGRQAVPTEVSDPMEAPDLGSRFLLTRLEGRVLHLQVNRPERRNSYTQDMYRGIKRAAVWADEQADLDAVCLTGVERWFGAGGDMGGNAEDPALQVEWDPTDHFPFRHIERCSKIWVAKINGLCLAGGLDIALHCDVTIASDQARFRVPELLRGIPDGFMTARLVERGRAGSCSLSVLHRGPRSTRPAALAMGLVGDVVAARRAGRAGGLGGHTDPLDGAGGPSRPEARDQPPAAARRPRRCFATCRAKS